MNMTVPLFPLPNVVLFPKTLRPLHIFEPRYRAMIAEAISGEGLIGMMFLKDGWENQYDQNPPMESIGCLGRIIQHNQLPDGRYYITLLGISSFELISEIPSEPFRTGMIETREELSEEILSPLLFERLSNVVDEMVETLDLTRELSWIKESNLDHESLVHHWSAFLPFTPTEKQFLLESPSIRIEAGRLYDLLLFRKFELLEDTSSIEPGSGTCDPLL
ncbi:LON peptidase substrate-binding domain-containing protein [Leptospirillum ferrooxidans]|jgi:hypothetical protein|uniref:Putative Lon family ATPdependent protease n=1 Tax=Leptospirillum ferrooxidans (strain C2-3) TaxID=1162668 RepID=I0IME9_LEPFC|nr:LON peptidase substrate-binding domain-containing protein [Leptospirillum ferrooxidans]BAM06448.1 putative Lon family ATPdependent protease [Leptospirillum ferrooxidans C2-3]